MMINRDLVGVSYSSSKSLTTTFEQSSNERSRSPREHISMMQFCKLTDNEQWKLVEKHNTLKQALKLIQLPDSNNLVNNKLLNVSLTELQIVNQQSGLTQ